MRAKIKNNNSYKCGVNLCFFFIFYYFSYFILNIVLKSDKSLKFNFRKAVNQKEKHCKLSERKCKYSCWIRNVIPDEKCSIDYRVSARIHSTYNLSRGSKFRKVRPGAYVVLLRAFHKFSRREYECGDKQSRLDAQKSAVRICANTSESARSLFAGKL